MYMEFSFIFSQDYLWNWSLSSLGAQLNLTHLWFSSCKHRAWNSGCLKKILLGKLNVSAVNVDIDSLNFLLYTWEMSNTQVQRTDS